MKDRLNEPMLSKVCEMITEHMGLRFSEGKRNMLTQNLALAAGEFGFAHLEEFIHWLLSTSLKKRSD